MGRKPSISIFEILRSVNKSHIFFPVQVNSLKIELKNEKKILTLLFVYKLFQN